MMRQRIDKYTIAAVKKAKRDGISRRNSAKMLSISLKTVYLILAGKK